MNEIADRLSEDRLKLGLLKMDIELNIPQCRARRQGRLPFSRKSMASISEENCPHHAGRFSVFRFRKLAAGLLALINEAA